MLEDIHGDIIYHDALDERIKMLQEHHDLPGADVCTTCDPDEHDELEALVQFRDDITQWCSDAAWNSSPGFLAESYFPKYAYESSCDLFGKEVVESGYFNDDAWEDDQREKFQEIDLDGVTYLIDKEL
jgi:hypothetical protein